MKTILTKINRFNPLKNKVLPLIILCLVLNACTLLNPTITKSKYNQVKTGMALSEVEKIIGKPGETTAEFAVAIPGVPNFPNGNQAFYQWKNADGGSMSAVFINDKLVFKSQANLQ